MRTQLAFFSLILLLPGLVRAEFYVEPRLSYLKVSGTPNVGDIGVVENSDFDRQAPSIGIGFNFTPRVSLELSYVSLGELELRKRSPNFNIFPTPGPVLPFAHVYAYHQKANAVALALPFKVIDRPKFSVSVAPLLQRADAEITFYELSPNVSVIAPGIIFHRRDQTTHGGGDVSAAYRLGAHAAVTLHYTYLALSTFDAHLFGAGFKWSF